MAFSCPFLRKTNTLSHATVFWNVILHTATRWYFRPTVLPLQPLRCIIVANVYNAKCVVAKLKNTPATVLHKAAIANASQQ